MSRARFVTVVVVVLAFAGILRFVWLTADPPVQGGVGIVWHDEGAWVHNARNRALWGVWRTDAWNPVFIAPVFTALEYAAFAAAGVGTWQARLVPALSGLAAVGFLIAGLAAIANRRAALVGGALLAANYGFVMWNRAALMESTMTAWIAIAWAAYALGERRPAWGVLAGLAACAAWFTKASAAFFVAALALDALLIAIMSGARPFSVLRTGAGSRRLGAMVLLGLVVSFAAAGALFVLPYWQEYRFYNWQMSVTRKPEYSIGAFVDRATWLPIVQSLFARMWIELTAAALGLLTIVARWRTARAGERLLVLWMLIGLAELVVHDSGNERRYVMFIPAIVALAALFIDTALARGEESARASASIPAIVAIVLVLPLGYLVAGSVARTLLLHQVEAGILSTAVRGAAVCAALLVAAAMAWRSRFIAWITAPHIPARLVLFLLVLAVAGQLAQFGLWASRRTTFNYDASVAIGRLLPPGTVVQGKLANGLALENRIRPIFIGNGFGNYDDRLRRDDARYILTYDLPRIGFESSDGSGLIPGILAHYPEQRTIATFVVDETPAPDRAALVDKFPTLPAHARD